MSKTKGWDAVTLVIEVKGEATREVTTTRAELSQELQRDISPDEFRGLALKSIASMVQQPAVFGLDEEGTVRVYPFPDRVTFTAVEAESSGSGLIIPPTKPDNIIPFAVQA